MKTITKLKQRNGETMVSVTVQTEPATINFQDILDACEVKPDEHADAPWDNSDGYDHEVIKDTTDGQAAGSFRDGRGRAMRVIPGDCADWGQAPRGASKQVLFELHALEVKRTVEQLASWHGNGFNAWGIVCDFQGYHDSCWGFYDENSSSQYMNDSIRDIAENVAAAMEQDGFTILNKPSEEQNKIVGMRERIRHNLGFGYYNSK